MKDKNYQSNIFVSNSLEKILECSNLKFNNIPFKIVHTDYGYELLMQKCRNVFGAF